MLPVTLQVMQSVQLALQTIAIADGYYYTVKTDSVVLDPEPLELVNVTLLPYFVIGDVEPGERHFSGSRPVAIQDTFTVPVSFRVDVPGTDRARKLTAAWQLVADVETALAKDPQRGGVALYTYVQQPRIYAGTPASNQVYGEIPVQVKLQRAYGAP